MFLQRIAVASLEPDLASFATGVASSLQQAIRYGPETAMFGGVVAKAAIQVAIDTESLSALRSKVTGGPPEVESFSPEVATLPQKVARISKLVARLPNDIAKFGPEVAK